ncbi:MAG: MFS transporter [Betaproteobacteria bacterium]|nr:MFS transporter [Betaproteobacteria bacterium]
MAAHRGLLAVFGSTLFQLCGVFMLLPLLLFLLKRAEVSNTVAGLFAATEWLGIFVVSPFASAIARKLGRRNALWLASITPLITACGFLFTDQLAAWFVLLLLGAMAGGMRWVLAEAFIAEFSPPKHRGLLIGAYATMIGMTMVVGPALLAWLGADDPAALRIVIGFMLIGLAWTALIPRLPQDADNATARVGLVGLWHAVRANPVVMLAGFVGGFFEMGLSSVLPIYGLSLGLPAGEAALLLSLSGLGGTLCAMPAGMVADRFASPALGRRRLMVLLAVLLLISGAMVLAVEQVAVLVWVVALLWGAAGGTLYTLTMFDIGSRETGITLVNSTAVLVLTYTLGALVASSAAGLMLDWSASVGLSLLLMAVAGGGVYAFARSARALAAQTKSA